MQVHTMVINTIILTIITKKVVEEVPVKWMDRPSATEINRGGASKMERHTKCHKNGNATEIYEI